MLQNVRSYFPLHIGKLAVLFLLSQAVFAPMCLMAFRVHMQNMEETIDNLNVACTKPKARYGNNEILMVCSNGFLIKDQTFIVEYINDPRPFVCDVSAAKIGNCKFKN